jgi:hypothetical protein
MTVSPEDEGDADDAGLDEGDARVSCSRIALLLKYTHNCCHYNYNNSNVPLTYT